MAGYSGTPLVKKLGIKPGAVVAIVAKPSGFEGELAPLPEGVVLRKQARGKLDVVLFFAKSQAELLTRFESLSEKLQPNGALWVAWPKKSSGVSTDLSFDVVQRVGLDVGLVDNKICAINEVWSGLRFVYRVEDRPRKKA